MGVILATCRMLAAIINYRIATLSDLSAPKMGTAPVDRLVNCSGIFKIAPYFTFKQSQLS